MVEVINQIVALVVLRSTDPAVWARSRCRPSERFGPGIKSASAILLIARVIARPEVFWSIKATIRMRAIRSGAPVNQSMADCTFSFISWRL